MNKFVKISLSIVALLIATSGVQVGNFDMSLEAAEVYTWVDNSGTKHYSDKPFKAAKKLNFSVPTPKKVDKKTTVEKPELFDLKDENRLQAECASAKNNVVNLLRGGKVLQKTDEGTTVVLTTEQMNEKLVKSQAFVKRYCSEAATDTDNT